MVLPRYDDKTLLSPNLLHQNAEYESSPSSKFGLDPTTIQVGRLQSFEYDLTLDRSSREDYFYSLYQNAKKTIQNVALTNTESNVKALESPNYPESPILQRDSTIFSSRESPLTFSRTSPKITDVTLSKSNIRLLQLPPPEISSYLPHSERNCETGSCAWPFTSEKCQGCRIHDPSHLVSSNSSYSQRAFFSNEYYLHQKEKWRRPRTVYTEKQLASLEKAYKKNKYLRGQERKELCKTLSLEERHIKVWYQNRRAKERGQIRHDRWMQRTCRKQQQKQELKDKKVEKT